VEQQPEPEIHPVIGLTFHVRDLIVDKELEHAMSYIPVGVDVGDVQHESYEAWVVGVAYSVREGVEVVEEQPTTTTNGVSVPVAALQ